jgi:hypothetical protein
MDLFETNRQVMGFGPMISGSQLSYVDTDRVKTRENFSSLSLGGPG